jgi:beta,beta-carotene 9',10'-dioxygenase
MDALNRRDLLKGAAGLGAAAALGGPASALARTAPAPDFAIGFTTLRKEVRLDRLPVEGRLPDWLRGTLVRNGPAQFEVGSEKFNHWFDGLAMLHAFSFQKGRVGYANRFLRSSQYRAAREEGRIMFSEFATDPCRANYNGASAFYVQAPIPNANVHVEALGRAFVAHTEIPLPVSFDAATLKTLGVVGDMPPVGRLGTAHPHADARTKERFAYQTDFAPPSGYRILGRKGGGADRVLAAIPSGKPGYMHSFGLTSKHIVIGEFPYRLDPAKILTSWKPVIENFEWDGSQPAQFHIIPRAGGDVRTIQAPSFFAFHHVNAFESGSKLFLDTCAFADPSIVQYLYLDKLRAGARGKTPTPTLTRHEIDLKTGKVRSRALSDMPVELPRTDYARVNGRDYRFVYGASFRDRKRSVFVDQIAKVDVRTGDARVWREAGAYPGEPVFVPAPGSKGEDDGAVLSVVLDARAGRSYLLVLDARSFTEMARARVPHHIPFGFHGRVF